MNGIIGFTDLIKGKKNLPEIFVQYIEVIEKSGDRLMYLINDLVDISKIETGLITTRTEEFNVNDTLHELQLIFMQETEDKGLSLAVVQKLPEGESVIVSDKGKVFQILSNLLKNATKFTESGSIEFGCRRKNEMLEFHVKDTGIGIDPKKHSSVFKRFFQADTSMSRGYEGSGLGLSISKAFVEALGGTIWVKNHSGDSWEGQGSTFMFTLPYNPPKV